MGEIVESVLSAYGRELDSESRVKISRYLEMLTSTGQTAQQLQAYGLTYLETSTTPIRVTPAADSDSLAANLPRKAKGALALNTPP
jgi:hypothetical protein